MTLQFTVAPATAEDAAAVAVMVGELLAEIMHTVGVPFFDFNLHDTITRLSDFIARDKYIVYLARDGEGHPAGFISLVESVALYAGGTIGTIPELYIRVSYRSAGIGMALVASARSCAVARGWKRLEVTTPPLPAFDRTLLFYEREGFEGRQARHRDLRR